MHNKINLEGELSEYLKNAFNHENIIDLEVMTDEVFVKAWQGYIEESKDLGVFDTLKKHLVQLKFPIKKGMSKNSRYLKAIRKGLFEPAATEACGLEIKFPEALELYLYQTLAGKIPIIFTPNREDFVTLLRALTGRNEPIAIPNAMGASIVKGYNNWSRIWAYKKQWQKSNKNNSEEDWKIEFKSIVPKKSLYQDKFIILSDNYYSDLSPKKIGIPKEKWQEMSLEIRKAHEGTHYFTERILGSARNNLLDELIADYMGILAATGTYVSDHFVLFMGLEDFPNINSNGRFQVYVDNGSISKEGTLKLAALVISASKHLEKIHSHYWSEVHGKRDNIRKIMTLTRLTLPQLASDNYEQEVLKWL